jgi:hypothetical protein
VQATIEKFHIKKTSLFCHLVHAEGNLAKVSIKKEAFLKHSFLSDLSAQIHRADLRAAVSYIFATFYFCSEYYIDCFLDYTKHWRENFSQTTMCRLEPLLTIQQSATLKTF